MRSIDKLAKRLLEEHQMEIDTTKFHRLYPGYWQRSAGAFSWYCTFKHSIRGIGSQFPVKELVKARELELANTPELSIYPKY